MSEIVRLFCVLMSDAAIARAVDTLRSGYVGQGPRVDEFEAALQAELGLPRRPVTVNSATTGLEMAFSMIGAGRGGASIDCAISTPATCLATNIPIFHQGIQIVWADVDRWGLIDPASVARCIEWMREQNAKSDDPFTPTYELAAIVAVDWGGRPCDYEAIRKAAPGVPIVQDAAHSYMTDFSGRERGDWIVWSFQAIKGLTTVDGGAVLTPDDQQDRARLLRWYGMDRSKQASFRCSQQIPELGWKWHMHDVAASIGLGNLAAAREGVSASRRNAKEILERIHGCCRNINVPDFDPRSSYWLLTVLADDPAAFIAHCERRGVEASQVHARNDVQEALGAITPFPLTGVDAFCGHEVCVPCGWWLTEPEIIRVVDAIRDYNQAG